MKIDKGIGIICLAIRSIKCRKPQQGPRCWQVSYSTHQRLFRFQHSRSPYSSMVARPHKITVYHLNNSRSIRITSLLEELSLPYDIVYLRRNEIGQAPQSLAEIHPLRKSPTVVIQHLHDSPEIVLHESAFILQYICEYWGEQYLPKKFLSEQQTPGTETEAWRRNRYWLIEPEGTLMPNIQIALLFHCEQGAFSVWFLKLIRYLSSECRSALLHSPDHRLPREYGQSKAVNTRVLAQPVFHRTTTQDFWR